MAPFQWLRFAVFCPLALWAQFDNSEITGFVFGPQRVGIGDAAVTLTKDGSGVTQKATTNGLGAYLFVAQRAGTYTLTVEAPGFRPFTRTGLELSVAQRLRVDVVLQVGAVTESITVTDQATPMVELETAGRGQVVNGRTIRELPLVNRDHQTLALLTPAWCLERACRAR